MTLLTLGTKVISFILANARALKSYDCIKLELGGHRKDMTIKLMTEDDADPIEGTVTMGGVSYKLSQAEVKLLFQGLYTKNSEAGANNEDGLLDMVKAIHNSDKEEANGIPVLTEEELAAKTVKEAQRDIKVATLILGDEGLQKSVGEMIDVVGNAGIKFGEKLITIFKACKKEIK